MKLQSMKDIIIGVTMNNFDPIMTVFVINSAKVKIRKSHFIKIFFIIIKVIKSANSIEKWGCPLIPQHQKHNFL